MPTRASPRSSTASTGTKRRAPRRRRLLQSGGGHYLVVLDRSEAARSATTSGHGGDRDARSWSRSSRRFPLASIRTAISQRVGCANQTTMLSSESLEIGEMFSRRCASATAMRTWTGDSGRSTRSAARRRTGRTPSSHCSASSPLDLMIVLGGYNSSNTCNLARICAEQRAHLSHRRSERPGVGRRKSGHKPVGGKHEVTSHPTGYRPVRLPSG